MTREIPRIARATAALYGVETGWLGADGQPQAASEATIRLVLRELGAPVTETSDLADAARFRRALLWRRICPPVRAVRQDGRLVLPLRLPAAIAVGRLAWWLGLEGHPPCIGEVRLETLPLIGGRSVDGERFEIRQLDIPVAIPAGYHRLVIRSGALESRVHVIGTPPSAFRGRRIEGGWGLSHPLYGLRDPSGQSIGSMRSLASALEWTGRQGGAVFGTTPLLAAFDDSPVDPSPYAPVSRLFWNDLYVDLDRASTVSGNGDLVRYEELLTVRKAALGEEAEAFFAQGGIANRDFQQFLRRMPEVSVYARFRAAGESHGRDWNLWPEPARSGRIPEAEIDRRVVQRHIYAQWLADRQLANLAARASAGLYLDVPLGTRPDGYDVWSRPGLFAQGASAGAPPDPYHQDGQIWGLPPLHPERIREEGYAYLAAALRHTMRYAELVRIDHVMQMQRVFWVPAGCSPKDGVYVNYPAEEMAAVVTLESQRACCEVVGEDLGTVPEALRELMHRRGIRRTWVLGFSLPAGPEEPLDEVPAGAVAAIGTHDMVPLRGLRDGVDIDDREERGLLQADEASRLRTERSLQFRGLARASGATEDVEVASDRPSLPDPTLPGVIRFLRRGRAGLVLLPLDDLAGQIDPQNVPGTTSTRPNWRRRLPVDLESLGASPEAEAVLAAMRGETS